MLNHLQHCLKWRRHDCDMLSTAISLIIMVSRMRTNLQFRHTIPSTHVCHNSTTHKIINSLSVKQSHLLSYDPKQIKLLMDTQSHCMPQEEAMPSLNYHFSRCFPFLTETRHTSHTAVAGSRGHYTSC